MTFTDRISILEHCDAVFPFGIGVEIGVAGGHFTKQIIATWKSIEKLHIVDPWKHFEEGYSDDCNLSTEVQEARYRQILEDFAKEPKVNVIRKMSLDAAEDFIGLTVDFVYLDANHSENAVFDDLCAWWPKLKHGGIISGHDYLSGNGKGYEVKRAVDDFAKRNDLSIYKTTEEFCRPSGIYGAGWEGCSFVLRKE